VVARALIHEHAVVTSMPAALDLAMLDRACADPIDEPDHHALRARSDHRVDTRRCSPVVRARLERDVERRAARPLAGARERHGLGVRFQATRGAARDHLAAANDQRPHRRIRRGAQPRALRRRNRRAHEARVGGSRTHLRNPNRARRADSARDRGARAQAYLVDTASSRNDEIGSRTRARRRERVSEMGSNRRPRRELAHGFAEVSIVRKFR